MWPASRVRYSTVEGGVWPLGCSVYGATLSDAVRCVASESVTSEAEDGKRTAFSAFWRWQVIGIPFASLAFFPFFWCLLSCQHSQRLSSNSLYFFFGPGPRAERAMVDFLQTARQSPRQAQTGSGLPPPSAVSRGLDESERAGGFGASLRRIRQGVRCA